MTTPELVFVVIGGVGLAVLLINLMLGGEADGGGAEVDVDADSGGMPSFFSLSVLSVVCVGLGAAGYITLSLGIPLIAAWICGVGGGVMLGCGILFGALRPLARQQYNSMLGRQSYVNRSGNVTLRVPAEGFGEVKFTDANGALVSERAWSHESAAIPQGTPVVIVEIREEGGVYVAPLELQIESRS